MSLIEEFPFDDAISGNDFILGSDAENVNQTKNYKISKVVDFLITQLPASSGGTNTLQNGSNINITGTGLVSDPYIISVTGIDGTITNLSAGSNIDITGTGVPLDPYAISVTGIDGSITNLSSGTNITITGTGTPGDPYVINNSLTSTTDENTLIGRTSSGNGAYESLTPAATRTLLDVEDTTALNTRDTNNRDRDNHTGTQLAATISDLITVVDARTGYNNTDWDTGYSKRIASMNFNTVTGDFEVSLGDSTSLTENFDGRYLKNVTQGTGISVDNTDPENPIISLSGGGSATINNYVNNLYRDIGGVTLVGAINGVNTAFTTSEAAYNAGSVFAFLNGQLLFAGSGIVETTPGSGIFNFETAPESGDSIVILYDVGSVSAGSGTGDMIGANNLSDVSSPTTSRTNLGLGALAVLDQVGSNEIGSAVVTNAKLANMSANTIKGRTTTNGVPQDLTATEVRTLTSTESTSQLDARDTSNRQRANHTGTQAVSTITNLQNLLNAKLGISATAADSSLLNGISPSLYARLDLANTFEEETTFPAIIVKDYDNSGIAATPNINLVDSGDIVKGSFGTPYSDANHVQIKNYVSGLALELRDDGDLTYDGNSLLGGGSGATQTSGTSTLTLNGFPTPDTTTAEWVKTGRMVTVNFSFGSINELSNANIVIDGFPYVSDGPGGGTSSHHFDLSTGTTNTDGLVANGSTLAGTQLRLYGISNANKNRFFLNNVLFGSSGYIRATITYFTTA